MHFTLIRHLEEASTMAVTLNPHMKEDYPHNEALLCENIC
jgi:hypothetical protein